jgi:hypothetical protein
LQCNNLINWLGIKHGLSIETVRGYRSILFNRPEIDLGIRDNAGLITEPVRNEMKQRELIKKTIKLCRERETNYISLLPVELSKMVVSYVIYGN